MIEVKDLQQPIDSLLAVHESAVARIKDKPRDPRELSTRAELKFERFIKRILSQFERVKAYLTQRSNDIEYERGRERERERERGLERERGRDRGRGGDDAASLAPSKRITKSTVEASDDLAYSASSVFLDSEEDHASEFDAERVSLEVPRSGEAAAVDDSNDDSDDDSITSDMMIQLTLSEDSQLEERKLRLSFEVDDFDDRLQKSLDDHIYNLRKNSEAVKEDAVK